MTSILRLRTSSQPAARPARHPRRPGVLGWWWRSLRHREGSANAAPILSIRLHRWIATLGAFDDRTIGADGVIVRLRSLASTEHGPECDGTASSPIAVEV